MNTEVWLMRLIYVPFHQISHLQENAEKNSKDEHRTSIRKEKNRRKKKVVNVEKICE